MNSTREIVVDNFAGGGGASTGIEIAMGRSVDVAINHDPAAIAMHRANHPDSKHYTEDIWMVDPVEACEGKPSMARLLISSSGPGQTSELYPTMGAPMLLETIFA